MRIIAGSLRRRTISVPRGQDVRPTTDRTREAIFNLIYGRLDLSSARILDLFAGSGALGFEAISRGAEHVTFVEKSPRVASVIQENARRLDIEAQVEIVVDEVERFVVRHRDFRFDALFADPPYTFRGVEALPDGLMGLIAPGGLLILEHDGRYDFRDHNNVVVTRAYGRTKVSLFAPLPAENDNG
jgi:16S rRNA (guanine966-N2)-methyltransferase